MRKPSRIPFFTQPLTRQPDGADASGSAARTTPEFSAAMNCSNRRAWSSPYLPGGLSKANSIDSCNMFAPAQAQGFQYTANFLHRFRTGRATRPGADTLPPRARAPAAAPGRARYSACPHTNKREQNNLLLGPLPKQALQLLLRSGVVLAAR